jgi:XRE family transcriptional regulator, regulator of sulfur utilization
MDDPRSNLGANLKRLRDMRGLSQEQAARQARIPRATWASLESGSANPTLVVLTRVAGRIDRGADRRAAHLVPPLRRG